MNTAIILILIGGSLGFVFTLGSFATGLFMAGILGYEYGAMWEYGSMINRYGFFGYPQLELDMMNNVIFVWSLLGFAGSMLSMTCGLKLRNNYSNSVVFVGLIGGVLMLLAYSWLSALMVLAGSMLAYLE